jgi:hypothetical protein
MEATLIETRADALARAHTLVRETQQAQYVAYWPVTKVWTVSERKPTLHAGGVICVSEDHRETLA